MSDSNSKGTFLFIFIFGIFALGFWLVYDLSSKGAVKAEMALNESKRRIEQLNTKVDSIKNYFKVELNKIDEAENRKAAKKGGGGASGNLANAGNLANKVGNLENQVRRLKREVRSLKALIREYEDM